MSPCWLAIRQSSSAVTCPTATIAVTAAAFALEHAYYPVLLPFVHGYGLAAAWVRQRAGRVAVTIPRHVLVDLGLPLAAAALS